MGVKNVMSVEKKGSSHKYLCSCVLHEIPCNTHKILWKCELCLLASSHPNRRLLFLHGEMTTGYLGMFDKMSHINANDHHTKWVNSMSEFKWARRQKKKTWICFSDEKLSFYWKGFAVPIWQWYGPKCWRDFDLNWRRMKNRQNLNLKLCKVLGENSTQCVTGRNFPSFSVSYFPSSSEHLR